jgi:N-acetylglucosamine malate deacetylase 1
MKRVLVISPHPDDESIGCGGTLRQHVVDGDAVHAVFLTSGERGGHGRPPQETAHLREQEARAAANILGLSAVEFWRAPDGGVSDTPRLVTRLAEQLATFEPDDLYVPHVREMHADHRAAALMVRRAVSLLPAAAPRPVVWMYEVWTPLQHFDRVADISPHVKVKLAAVRAHASQCRIMRFDDACLALARYRGEMHSWPGGDYAEVFREWQPAAPMKSSATGTVVAMSRGSSS